MVIDKLDYPVFEKDWSLIDEAQFLQGIESCGLDNWCTVLEYMNNAKNVRDLFAHFYTFYYNPLEIVHSIESMNEHKNNGRYNSAGSTINSLVIYRNPSIKWDMFNLNKDYNHRYLRVNIDQDKLSLNHKKVEKTKNLFQEEFFTICSIGRDEGNDSRSTKPNRTVPVRKNLAKILGYNPKRKEFEEEDIEELIAELNFDIPNYNIEISAADAKKDSRKREKGVKETISNIDIPYQQKLDALKYYNSVIDKRREQYRIVQEWGLLDQEENPMEKIIMQTEEEREFVGAMKIFARFFSAKGFANFVNSLLLEKNLRELVGYLREAKTKGRFDLEILKEKCGKKVFRYMQEQWDIEKPEDDIVEVKEEGVVNRKRKHRQSKQELLEKLQRESLEPDRCYGLSLSIPLCKGYNMLNEKERILVEELGILPESFSVIKKRIIETTCVEGTIQPPEIATMYHKTFWHGLEKYIKLHSDHLQSSYQQPNSICKYKFT